MLGFVMLITTWRRTRREMQEPGKAAEQRWRWPAQLLMALIGLWLVACSSAVEPLTLDEYAEVACERIGPPARADIVRGETNAEWLQLAENNKASVQTVPLDRVPVSLRESYLTEVALWDNLARYLRDQLPSDFFSFVDWLESETYQQYIEEASERAERQDREAYEEFGRRLEHHGCSPIILDGFSL